MPRRARALLSLLALTALLALAACESAEQRAERHYLAGLALLEAGDETRAILEFRNVFRYDRTHLAARGTFARLLLDKGRLAEGYAQYLYLIEDHPDTLEARLTLAEIALEWAEWPEADRHGRAAIALAPEVPRARALAAALDYRMAVLTGDTVARDRAIASARALVAEDPALVVARRVSIDARVAGPDPLSALPEIEAAIALDPEGLEFHSLKLRVLASNGQTATEGAQLQLMAELFPENEEVARLLVRWYLANDETDAAEGYLRARAAAAPELPGPNLEVIAFLQTLRGPDAALAEAERLAQTAAGTPLEAVYRGIGASIVFDAGRRDEAIAGLETLLREAAPSDEARDAAALLARMLETAGDRAGAQARVAEVLEADAGHVEALKLLARWEIAADRPGEAIVALRTALGQSPQDPDIATLLAAAHEREGARDLMGESLALAVRFSGSGAAESLRYAGFLMREGRPEPADAVLTDALRRSPEDVRLLSALAEVRTAARDWPRTQQVIRALRRLDDPEAGDAANRAQVALLLAQERADETISFLQGLIGEGNADVTAVAVVLRTLVIQDKLQEARAFLESRLALDAQNRTLRFLDGNLLTVEGRTAEAEAIYNALILEDPLAEQPVTALYQLLRREGRDAEALVVLEAALAAGSRSVSLRWFRANEHERRGEFDAAIAVYEEAYAIDGNNIVIANNLASLLSTRRTDEASLERAFTVARRLRNEEVPAIQDTYGWIEYRRGNPEAALPYLEAAAQGLPDDAPTQAHLGLTLAALGQTEAAQEVLTRALELAGDDPLPTFEAARAALADLPLLQ